MLPYGHVLCGRRVIVCVEGLSPGIDIGLINKPQ